MSAPLKSRFGVEVTVPLSLLTTVPFDPLDTPVTVSDGSIVSVSLATTLRVTGVSSFVEAASLTALGITVSMTIVLGADVLTLPACP